ncbi:TPA: hypothetical protein ACG3P3_001596 [Clostridioides difficile]
MCKLNKFKITIILFFVLMLTGCNKTVSLDVAQSKVDNYNKLVLNTMKSYKDAYHYAKEKKDIIKDIYEDDGIARNEKYKLDRMTEEQKNAFKIRNSVAFDKYFTSIGMTGIKEILIINGSEDYIMTIVLYWNVGSLLGIERNVYINN